MNGRPSLLAVVPERPAALHGAKYSVAELAKACGVSPSYLRKVIRAGELFTHHCGRRLVITEADAEAWFASKRTGGTR